MTTTKISSPRSSLEDGYIIWRSLDSFLPDVKCPSDQSPGNSFCEIPFSNFPVRGANYLKDGKKYPSTEYVANLECAEMFSIPRSDSSYITQGHTYYTGAEHWKNDGRFHMAVIMELPLKNHSKAEQYNFDCKNYSCCVASYHTFDPAIVESNLPFKNLFDIFSSPDCTEEWLNSHLKYVPKIVAGGWLLKKMVNNKPVIMGNKVDCSYYRHPETNTLECIYRVVSNSTAVKCVNLAYGCIDSLQYDFAWILEGKETTELPEVAMCGARICKLDPKNSRLALLEPRMNFDNSDEDAE